MSNPRIPPHFKKISSHTIKSKDGLSLYEFDNNHWVLVAGSGAKYMEPYREPEKPVDVSIPITFGDRVKKVGEVLRVWLQPSMMLLIIGSFLGFCVVIGAKLALRKESCVDSVVLVSRDNDKCAPGAKGELQKDIFVCKCQ